MATDTSEIAPKVRRRIVLQVEVIHSRPRGAREAELAAERQAGQLIAAAQKATRQAAKTECFETHLAGDEKPLAGASAALTGEAVAFIPQDWIAKRLA